MILQETYHRLQEWIIMLDCEDFKNNDAGLVREEMMKHCAKIWKNRAETNLKDIEEVFPTPDLDAILGVGEK